MFEALLIVENVNDLLIATVNFIGSREEFAPFSLNRMGDSVAFDAVETNLLLTVTVNHTLDPDDENVDYLFTMQHVVTGSGISKSESVNVILHEIGKLINIS